MEEAFVESIKKIIDHKHKNPEAKEFINYIKSLKKEYSERV